MSEQPDNCLVCPHIRQRRVYLLGPVPHVEFDCGLRLYLPRLGSYLRGAAPARIVSPDWCPRREERG